MLSTFNSDMCMYTAMVQYENKFMRALGGTRVISSRVPKAAECKSATQTFSMTLLAVKCLANGHTNSSVLGMMSK